MTMVTSFTIYVFCVCNFLYLAGEAGGGAGQGPGGAGKGIRGRVMVDTDHPG